MFKKILVTFVMLFSLFALTSCGGGETPSGCSHDYTVTSYTPATCTSNGVKEETCSKCGDVKITEYSATGHNFIAGICSKCGERE